MNVAWTLWRIDPQQEPRVVPVFQALRRRANSDPDHHLACGALGALWQIAPELRDELRLELVAMLKECKAVRGRRRVSLEMKTLLPALTEIANDANFQDLRPCAVMLIRSLNQVEP